MISVPDMAIIGALALMLFGPEQLPKVARKVGHVMRDIQNTSQAFIREMERAADEYEPEGAVPHYDPYLYEPLPERPPEPPAPADEARQTQPGTSPDGEAPRHARPSAQPEYRIESPAVAPLHPGEPTPERDHAAYVGPCLGVGWDRAEPIDGPLPGVVRREGELVAGLRREVPVVIEERAEIADGPVEVRARIGGIDPQLTRGCRHQLSEAACPGG